MFIKQPLTKLLFLIIVVLTHGCTAITTFPTVARAGDTISVMVGGSEKARKDTVSAIITDANGQVWDLQADGLVRSVFALRTDGRAKGLHYSSYLSVFNTWYFGHEPVQTVLVLDLPTGIAPGDAVLTVNPNVDDNSSGFSAPYNMGVEVLAGTGVSDDFKRRDLSEGPTGVDFSKLEPASHAKISFARGGSNIVGAASLKINFDKAILNPDDISVYVPESIIRSDSSASATFGSTQRMVYWRYDGQYLLVDVVAPQGVETKFLMAYLMHPDSVTTDPLFTIVSSDFYNINGDIIPLTPLLTYYP